MSSSEFEQQIPLQTGYTTQDIIGALDEAIDTLQRGSWTSSLPILREIRRAHVEILADEAEAIPTCDICGDPEDQRIGPFENDWNGETGNHKSCEEEEARRARIYNVHS